MNIGVLVGLLLLSIPITVIITLLDEHSIALRIILVILCILVFMIPFFMFLAKYILVDWN